MAPCGLLKSKKRTNAFPSRMWQMTPKPGSVCPLSSPIAFFRVLSVFCAMAILVVFVYFVFFHVFFSLLIVLCLVVNTSENDVKSHLIWQVMAYNVLMEKLKPVVYSRTHSPSEKYPIGNVLLVKLSSVTNWILPALRKTFSEILFSYRSNNTAANNNQVYYP